MSVARIFIVGVILLFLGSCAITHPTPPPPLQRIGLTLAPDTLGKSIQVQQHLTIIRANQAHDLDTVLDINPQRLYLVGMMLGHRVMTLSYDGKTLTTWRDPHMPSQITGEEILEDIQLTLWPENVLRTYLPPQWHIKQKNNHRIIYLNHHAITAITYFHHKTVLKNMPYHYTLIIQSAPL